MDCTYCQIPMKFYKELEFRPGTQDAYFRRVYECPECGLAAIDFSEEKIYGRRKPTTCRAKSG